MTASAVELIQQVFSGFNPDQLETLSGLAPLKRYPDGEVLCHEGELEKVFYVIAEGEAEIYKTFDDGATRVLDRRKAGEFFGEMGLIENKPRSASVVTRGPTTVLEISQELFDTLLRSNPSVAIAMMRRLTASLRSTDAATIQDLSLKNTQLAKAYAELKAAQAELVAKQRLERELEIAAEVQQSLLPASFPAVAGYGFSGRNVPARHVGGDLYDVIPLDDEHYGLLLADVSDKSVHAALFMAVTRALFISEARRSLSPAVVAQAVHRGLLDVSSKDTMFVTAFYGVLHAPSGRLTYVRAGQDRPLWLRANGEPAVHLDAKGRFLGMLDVLMLEEGEVTLSPGDALVMYSDGVPDADDTQTRPYTLERLVKLMEANRQLPAEGLCSLIFDDVFLHRGAAEATDDITVLVVKSNA